MAQLLYEYVEAINRRRWLQMAGMEMGCNLRKVGQFFKFTCVLESLFGKANYLSSFLKNALDIFSLVF